MMSGGEILQALRERNVKQVQVAEWLALPASAVSALFSGRRQLKLDEAIKLLGLLQETRGEKTLPVIGMAGAGRWIEAIEEARDTIVLPPEVKAPGRFAVEVIGDSMNLILPEGSLAAIDPDDTRLFNGKTYLLLNGDGEATIKRYRSDPARFEPVSDNPSHTPFEVGTLDFRIIGRVTAAITNL